MFGIGRPSGTQCQQLRYQAQPHKIRSGVIQVRAVREVAEVSNEDSK